MAGGYHGAFKPPTSLPLNNAASSILRSHDPRDAKHPLSICQLTNGNSEAEVVTGVTHSNSTNPTGIAAAICAANAVANSAALLSVGVPGLR